MLIDILSISGLVDVGLIIVDAFVLISVDIEDNHLIDIITRYLLFLIIYYNYFLFKSIIHMNLKQF
jgi:hypothetical protein